MKTLKLCYAALVELFRVLAETVSFGLFLLICAAWAVLVVVATISLVRAAPELTVCRVNDAPGILLRFTYDIDHAPIAWYHYAEGGYWTYTTEWGGEATITRAGGYAEYLVLDYGDSDYRVIHGDGTTGFCNPQTSGDLPTITLWNVQGNLFTWEIQDDYGNWHDVHDSSGTVYTPVEWAGDMPFSRLVLGRDNPVLDPLRYRVTVRG